MVMRSRAGVPAAQGYAPRVGYSLGDGFVKNATSGARSSTESEATGRRRAAEAEPLPRQHQGEEARRRPRLDRAGTTTRQTSRCCAKPARSRCYRVSSPPYRWPCFYGLDTGERSDLLAADMSVGEISDYLGVDSLAYLDLDRTVAATGSPPQAFCDACFTGIYPVPVPERHEAPARAGARDRLAIRRRRTHMTHATASRRT